MLVSCIEMLISYIVNRRGAARPGRPTAKAAPVPGDHILLGRPAASGSDPWSRTSSVTGPVTLSTDDRRRHVYILGATGKGKTYLIRRLIASDLANSNNGSCVVVDLRGDMVDSTLRQMADLHPPDAWRERLLLVDLRQSEHVVAFNPLLGAGSHHNRAFHVLGVLRQQVGSWGVQLEETLRNCLIALAETGWSLLEIEPLLSNAGFRREVLAQVSDAMVRSFFVRFEAMSAERQAEWCTHVLNKVTPLLALPELRLMLGQRRSFSFPDLLDHEPGRVILISLAVDRLHQAAHLVGGLLVSAFQTAMMARVDQPEEDRVPVNLYVDEFETMATESFGMIVAEGRKFGLGLTLSHQNLSQLPLLLRDTLLNNCQTLVCFGTGAADAAVLAREIVSDKPKKELQETLMLQPVGKCFVIRRSLPPVQIQVEGSQDPSIDASAVQAIQETSFQTFGRTRLKVEQELAERERYLEALRASAPQPERGRGKSGGAGKPVASTNAGNSEDAAPRYEIHRAPPAGMFKPKPCANKENPSDE